MVLRRIGIEVAGRLYDTMILHYLLDPEGRHNMNALALRYLDYRPIEIETLIGRGARQLTMDLVAIDRVKEYAAEDADVTLRLKRVLWPRVVETGMEALYVAIEEPMIRVLADITGICAAKARVVCRGTCAVTGVELVVEAPRVVENSRMCKNLKCLVVGAEFFEAHSQGMVEHAFVVVHAVHRAVAAVERHLAGIHEIAPLAEKVVGRCRQFRYFFIVYCHMVPKISIKIVKIKHIPDGIGSPAVCWLCCRS